METPQTPKSFGHALRDARVESGRTLAEIAAETKVSIRILEALESGQFRYLPERIFSRNFVRQYASVINVDPDQWSAWFDAAWEHFQISSGSQPIVLTAAPPATPRRVNWQLWIPVALAVIIAVVLLLLGIQSRDASPVGGTTEAREGTSEQPRPGLPAVPSPTATSRSTQVETPPSAESSELVRFRVETTAECWIRYRDVSGRVEQRQLTAGDVLEDQLPGPVVLTLGNAGAATLLVAGQTYTDLGESGEVVHLALTSDSVEARSRWRDDPER
jgi:cytoskeletal protein RodZ